MLSLPIPAQNSCLVTRLACHLYTPWLSILHLFPGYSEGPWQSLLYSLVSYFSLILFYFPVLTER